jgi:hypothetical protein
MLPQLLNRLSILFLLVLLICLISTCERIPGENAADTKLENIKITNLKGIPAEYGPLFAVTANGAHPGWAQLWFLDNQGTIRMVRLDFHHYNLAANAIAIPRN